MNVQRPAGQRRNGRRQAASQRTSRVRRRDVSHSGLADQRRAGDRSFAKQMLASAGGRLLADGAKKLWEWMTD